MTRRPSLFLPSLSLSGALLLVAAPLLFSQSQPAAQNPQQAETVVSPASLKLQYFELEHRSPDQLESADSGLLEKRKRDVLAEAEFYGYDLKSGGWDYEQSVCPFAPDYLMLHYSSKDAAGIESRFTALVPRNGGRVLFVPVLSHGATRFKPAPQDPRNFQIFSQIVPADVAKKNSGPDGKWLSLSVCYAEMTGARPRVPNLPSLDAHMIKAPPPTLRLSVKGQEHEVSFVDPISPTDYRLWDITYNEAGRIISVTDNQHGFGEPVVKTVPEPAPKPATQPPPPPAKIIPASKQANPYPQAKQSPQ